MLRTWNMNQQSGHLVNIQLMGPLAYEMAMVDHQRAMMVEAQHMAEADRAFWDQKRQMHQELYTAHEKAFRDMGGMNAVMSMIPTAMGMNGMHDLPSTQTLRQSPSGQRQDG
ncbi:MAG: hypothetical protein ACM3ZA_09220 [Bacillota bacterium]